VNGAVEGAMSDDGFPTRWAFRRRFYGPRRLLRGLVARIVASIAIMSAGAVFIVAYLGFFAVRFPWYQNVAVVLSTLLVVPVALLVMWVLWGLGVGDRVLRDGYHNW
jgi:amino acid transporter